MTTLYIDGAPVSLPQGFSQKVTFENPLITKNGNFTWDLTLSLEDPDNARLYQHLNRVNYSASIQENRKAMLIVDDRVVLIGTEVVLSNTEKNVKIQLVSGNSELNYISGQSMYIGMLDLGDLPSTTASPATLTEALAVASLSATWPTMDYICPTVMTYSDASMAESTPFIFLNNYKSSFFTGSKLDNEQFNFEQFNLGDGTDNPLIETKNLVPMPYLMSYIEKVLEKLGYSIDVNEISESYLAQYYIVHNGSSSTWQGVMNKITVGDFLTACESFLGIFFLVNQRNKTIQIRLRKSYLTGRPVYAINEVIHEYERKIVEESDDIIALTRSKVSYTQMSADNDRDYLKMQDLSDSYIQSASLISWPSLDDLIYDFNSRTPEQKNTAAKGLHVTVDNGQRFIYRKYRYNIPGYENYYLFPVSEFQHVNAPSGSVKEFELLVHPCPMRADIMLLRTSSVEQYAQAFIQLPCYTQSTANSVEDLTAEEQIINDESTTKLESIGSIPVCLYSGQHLPPQVGELAPLDTVYYPASYEVPESLYVLTGATGTPPVYREIFGTHTMALDGTDGLINQLHAGTDLADYTKEYTFDFLYSGEIDVTSIFLIHNRKFVCKQIELDVTIHGINQVVRGIFYEVL